MESCGMNVSKYFLFVFNLIFAISGIGIIVAGALVLVNVSEFNHFVEGRIIAPPIVLIVAGAIIFIIAFLGCYGAIKEHYNLLIAFAVALLIIFVIELAVGIAAAVFKNDFSMAMKDTLKKSMQDYKESDIQAWDTVQSKLQCCGVDGPEDWIQASKGYPRSCCNETQSLVSCPLFNANKEGCFSKLEMRVQNSAKVLIGVGIGIAFIEGECRGRGSVIDSGRVIDTQFRAINFQIAGVILACYLAAAVKKESNK